MQKTRILQSRPYRIPWYQAINWNVAIDLVCWLLVASAIIAISGVILFGSFLREIFG